MDLGTISRKLDKVVYSDIFEFKKDMNLVLNFIGQDLIFGSLLGIWQERGSEFLLILEMIM